MKQPTDLFKAFASSKRSGLGLGLAISRSIAQNHGGELTVDAGGSVLFPVVLPSIPGLCGTEMLAQALLFGDPGAAGAKQTAQTNFVELVFGD